MRARCADGPYAGQTFEFPLPYERIQWNNWEWNSDESNVGRRFPVSEEELPIAPLMWINYGTDRHCYQLAENGHYGGWRLVYRDTF
jgi:hypothetical protein